MYNLGSLLSVSHSPIETMEQGFNPRTIDQVRKMMATMPRIYLRMVTSTTINTGHREGARELWEEQVKIVEYDGPLTKERETIVYSRKFWRF